MGLHGRFRRCFQTALRLGAGAERRSGEQAAALSCRDGLPSRMRVEYPEKVLEMVSDGDRRELEFRRDLVGREPRGEQVEYFALASGQCGRWREATSAERCVAHVERENEDTDDLSVVRQREVLCAN